ncbi:MAG: hypothetical protein WAV05_00685 [Anaerolineales bacterium]
MTASHAASPSVTSRPYESESDLQEMLDMLMVERSLTDDWHYPHTGELLFNFFMAACHLNPIECIRVITHKLSYFSSSLPPPTSPIFRNKNGGGSLHSQIITLRYNFSPPTFLGIKMGEAHLNSQIITL